MRYFLSTLILFLSCTTLPEDVLGCTDSSACNFNTDANENDGSCAYIDCLGICGGDAYIDDCSDCSGGATGLGHNHNDPDSDTVCDDGAANGEADNCPETANTDQWNYDGDTYGDACDSDDDNDGATDGVDSEDNNEYACSDTDEDSCDDCSSGTYDVNGSGADDDGDGQRRAEARHEQYDIFFHLLFLL